MACPQASTTYTALAIAQRKDVYHTSILGLVLEDVQFNPTDSTLLCDVFTRQLRPIISADWRRWIFNMIYNLADPSIQTTKH